MADRMDSLLTSSEHTSAHGNNIEMMWITNPFLSPDGELLEMIPKEEEEFTERRNNTDVKHAHKPMPRVEFWLHASGEFPDWVTMLCESAFRLLPLPFVKTDSQPSPALKTNSVRERMFILQYLLHLQESGFAISSLRVHLATIVFHSPIQ